jgi:hypothetical protein
VLGDDEGLHSAGSVTLSARFARHRCGFPR